MGAAPVARATAGFPVAGMARARSPRRPGAYGERTEHIPSRAQPRWRSDGGCIGGRLASAPLPWGDQTMLMIRVVRLPGVLARVVRLLAHPSPRRPSA
jgi:hypothetical protein